jgi:hypothetical protein
VGLSTLMIDTHQVWEINDIHTIIRWINYNKRLTAEKNLHLDSLLLSILFTI